MDPEEKNKGALIQISWGWTEKHAIESRESHKQINNNGLEQTGLETDEKLLNNNSTAV